jgi:hypothetical protein
MKMLSDHAKKRMQQRAIPLLAPDLICLFGREHQQCGSTIFFLDKNSKKKARKALEDLINRFDKLSDIYVVEADGCSTTITVGHHLKRFKSK